MTTIEIETCPGQLQWSAFGARYEDTQCGSTWTFDATGEPVGPYLQDLDSDRVQQDIPCPFCDPAGFTGYQWGGADEYVVIWGDGEHAPEGTELHFHNAPDLWWSATHPERGEERVGVRRRFDDDEQEAGR